MFSSPAAILAINRLCAPGSERAIEARWYPTTALEDVRHIPDGTVNDRRLYRALDQRLPHKTALERHLTTRDGELFAAEFDVFSMTSRAPTWKARWRPIRCSRAATAAITAAMACTSCAR